MKLEQFFESIGMDPKWGNIPATNNEPLDLESNTDKEPAPTELDEIPEEKQDK